MKVNIRESIKKIDYKLARIISSLSLIPVLLCNKISVLAKSEDELGFLKNADGSTGPFSGVNKTVKETGASLYAVVRNIGFIVLVIGIAVIALGIASTKNGNKRDEHKLHLIWFILGTVLFFGGFTVMAMAKTIAAGF